MIEFKASLSAKISKSSLLESLSNDAKSGVMIVNSFKSSNLIPKDIRTLFKRKGKLSKAYRKVKTINRCSSIRKKLLEIDIKLKNHYENKLLEDEMKVFDKAKANKNVLFNYIKKNILFENKRNHAVILSKQDF